IVPAMLLGGCAGVAIFGSRTRGVLAAVAVLAVVALLHSGWLPEWNAQAAVTAAASAPGQPTLWDVTAFFFKVGALTFGGGYTMLAFVQHQVVNQLQWLTSREFLNGLALGQITPGPILMVAAYVGYKVGGLAGAVLAATTIFLPAFLWMLAVLPILDLFKHWAWVKQSMRGISAAVIGLIAVALVQLTPSAVPDIPAGVIGLATVAVLLWRPIGPLPLMVAGGVLGVLRMTLLAGL
ncbi:MAG TPA: chromate transporter, partial [bacterium]